MKKVNVGIIGCGKISDIYLKNLTGKFSNMNVLAVSDLDVTRAKEKAEQYAVKKVLSVDELLNDPKIDIVLNITTPDAHYNVCKAALEKSKHVYVEKPLTISLSEGKELLAIAKKNNVRIGAAPDTFLGGGIQTCLKLIQDGWIGQPVAAVAFMTCHGHESWHPDPEFYYKVGGGPMFDMGPYYLTALISLLGPIKRVCGSARISFDKRVITSEKKYGNIIDVEVPTHVAGIIDFENGAIGTIVTSFDVWSANLPRIEIYGSLGTLCVPDPNTFGGPIRIRKNTAKEFSELPLTHGFAENSRGIGLTDMASAIKSGRKHRANGEMAYHVLETMHGFHISSDTGKHYNLESTCQKPAALPLGLSEKELD